MSDDTDDPVERQRRRMQARRTRLKLVENITVADGLVIECASGIKQQPVDWIWPGRIALGKMTLLGGDPGAGKSQIATDICARMSKGRPWPDDGKAELGSSIIL